jgi:hypothetical protein
MIYHNRRRDCSKKAKTGPSGGGVDEYSDRGLTNDDAKKKGPAGFANVELHNGSQDR